MMNGEQNPKADGRTVRAAKNALAKKQISAESYAAVLDDRLNIQEARELGRDKGPDALSKPISRISKSDTTQECWCEVCGEQTNPGRRFRPGHDQRAKGMILRAIREGKTNELSERLEDYGKERGLI